LDACEIFYQDMKHYFINLNEKIENELYGPSL